MPRSETTFTPGNSIALKLTPEVHQTFVDVVATTGRLTAAAGKCRRLGVGAVNFGCSAAAPKRKDRSTTWPLRSSARRQTSS